MKKTLTGIVLLLMLAGCGSKKGVTKFEVSGKIVNNPAKVIYLEEIPMTTMQRLVVDSAVLGADGKFNLKTGAAESRVYNLRLDQSPYPVAAIINDAPKITVNAIFSKENTQFADSFTVKGSPASQEMKNFMIRFNNQLQEIFYKSRQLDSLRKNNGSDSALYAVEMSMLMTGEDAQGIALDALKKSKNPALSMFILGYYQSTANNPGYNLRPLAREQIRAVMDEEAAKFPDHKDIAAIRASLQGLVGKPAPEIALPDPNGKEIRLSSFRGKYVLVDFWASWCKPCRDENPNVVNAYNRFKDKNFTILGVSLDRPGGKDSWMTAVMKDNLTWTQVSDLKYWESPVVSTYQIEGIPYNVLVDPQGIIIAESLRGPDLEKKLAEVLK